jgi:hypothetical protein
MPTAFVVGTLAAVVMGLGVASPAWAASQPPPTLTPTSSVTVSVSRTPVGRPIASGFIGLSVEFPAVTTYTGLDPTQVNPVFVQLIRNLAPGQTPVVRIGGNSTDATWYPTAGVTPTPGIHNTITKNWLSTVRTFAQDAGAKLILGLNLKLGSAAEITAEAHAFLKGIGRKNIEGLEIGNEPELYSVAPWYKTSKGKSVYSRTHAWSFAAYARQVSAFAAKLPGIPIVGPATGQLSWLVHLGKLFSAEPDLKVVTYHRYPLLRCFSKPGQPGFPTLPELLEISSSRDLLDGAAPYIALAHRHGAQFRVDELNSVACKGVRGVSNTFASALWMEDTLFSMARSGVDGVNIHTLPEAKYKLFTFWRENGHWMGTVRPEYYALLMFEDAAPPGSRLLQISTPSDPDVRAWATLTPTNLIHVVLINASLTSANEVMVSPPGHPTAASLEWLSASSATATGGVTLGGQSFGSQTSTGLLTGAVSSTALTRTNGSYAVDMPAASAAMLTLTPAAG